jgi:hypothetical protein
MQLQGELAKSGVERVYKSAPDVIAKTFRNEGIRGLQRGLGPAVRACGRCISSMSTDLPWHSMSIRCEGLRDMCRDQWLNESRRC